MIVCSRLTSDGLEVSKTKSVVTATTKHIGEAVAAKLGAFQMKYASKVKGHGVAMAAGTRQHGRVRLDRLRAFRQRRWRFHRLRRLGLRTDRLVCTVGLASITYAEFASGVNPSLLHRQRQAVAAATATAAGSGGQNVDYA